MEQQDMVLLDNYTPATELVIISKGRFCCIPFETIHRVIKKGPQLTIVAGKEKWYCYHNIEEISNELPVNQFVRITKSLIIRIDQLQNLPPSLRISDFYKKQLQQKLANLLNQQYRWLMTR